MTIPEKIAARDAHINKHFPNFAQESKWTQKEILHEARLCRKS